MGAARLIAFAPHIHCNTCASHLDAHLLGGLVESFDVAWPTEQRNSVMFMLDCRSAASSPRLSQGLGLLWIAVGFLDVVALIDFREFDPNPPPSWPPTCSTGCPSFPEQQDLERQTRNSSNIREGHAEIVSTMDTTSRSPMYAAGKHLP